MCDSRGDIWVLFGDEFVIYEVLSISFWRFCAIWLTKMSFYPWWDRAFVPFRQSKVHWFCQSDLRNDWFWRLTHASDGFYTQNCHSGSLRHSKTNLRINVGPFVIRVREKKLQKVKKKFFILSPYSKRQLENKIYVGNRVRELKVFITKE